MVSRMVPTLIESWPALPPCARGTRTGQRSGCGVSGAVPLARIYMLKANNAISAPAAPYQRRDVDEYEKRRILSCGFQPCPTASRRSAFSSLDMGSDCPQKKDTGFLPGVLVSRRTVPLLRQWWLHSAQGLQECEDDDFARGGQTFRLFDE